MLRANRAALATFVLHERQHLVAIRPRADALVLETLLYADEVRDPVQEIDTLPVDAQWSPQELDTALLLIDSMTTDWDPRRYRDAYRERLEELIDEKRAGKVVPVAPQSPEGAPVIDLLQALEASLRAARAARGPESASTDTAGTGTAGTETAERGEPGKRPAAARRRKAS
jgi:DNA end-binding protein Ku